MPLHDVTTNKPTPFATALRATFRRGYSASMLRDDLLAGLTVGVVAVPLSMALAIASGVAPQYGLYTAIVAGFIIALTGGSRLSVSGPTAAFVVVLLPIANQFGLGGLAMASIMAGILLVLMGVAHFGTLIQYIPYPVTTGFTAGIAVVIASLQIKDFFGLTITASPEHFHERILVLFQALPSWKPTETAVGLLTLAILFAWPRFQKSIPSALVALSVSTTCAWLASHWFPEFHVETIASRFHYIAGGVEHAGVPPLPPLPSLPWHLPATSGHPLEFGFAEFKLLLGPAFAIAMLGAIESLLCAVVVDGLAAAKHDPDAELIGQGIGNVIAPFFGGFAATGAIARSATNFRAGGKSPVAAAFHAVVVLIAVLVLAPVLNHLPMAALAALLFKVAVDISEARHAIFIARVAPRSDVAVLLTCFVLMVFVDMVVAIGAGVVLAALLFMRRMADLSHVTLIEADHPHIEAPLPAFVRLYDISGPLFFGAAEKAASALSRHDDQIKVAILHLGGVPTMDVTGLVALESAINRLRRANICVALAGVQKQPAQLLRKAGVKDIPGELAIFPKLSDAIDAAVNKLASVPCGKSDQTSANK